jgi:hypothetical protein
LWYVFVHQFGLGSAMHPRYIFFVFHCFEGLGNAPPVCLCAAVRQCTPGMFIIFSNLGVRSAMHPLYLYMGSAFHPLFVQLGNAPPVSLHGFGNAPLVSLLFFSTIVDYFLPFSCICRLGSAMHPRYLYGLGWGCWRPDLRFSGARL